MRMRDLPMLDIDRARMREEFEGFDDMTIEEWAQVAKIRMDELRGVLSRLGEV